MNCPKCETMMVKARATNFGDDYDYCRTCKMELAEIQRIPMNEEPSSAYERAHGPTSSSRNYTRPNPQTLAVKRKLIADDDGFPHVRSVVRIDQTLFGIDSRGVESCRSIDTVAVHFWHRVSLPAHARQRTCQCGTYRRPGELAEGGMVV